jgi:2-amino-4-hydroxy-6-hydroxymethyldihydropteridine diphosphokinase
LTARKVQQAVVAFGSNLQLNGKNLPEIVRLAVNILSSDDLQVVALSRLFASPCFPAGAGPDYVNAAALIQTPLAPAALLARLHGIEADFNRERLERWGPRTLDLDLLAMGDLILPDAATHDHWRTLAHDQQARLAPEQLILPHPRLQDRAFVLVPMADVAPDWRHPRLGLTVLEMLAALKTADIAAVTPL